MTGQAGDGEESLTISVAEQEAAASSECYTRAGMIETRALLRLERTMNLLCH